MCCSVPHFTVLHRLRSVAVQGQRLWQGYVWQCKGRACDRGMCGRARAVVAGASGTWALVSHQLEHVLEAGVLYPQALL